MMNRLLRHSQLMQPNKLYRQALCTASYNEIRGGFSGRSRTADPSRQQHRHPGQQQSLSSYSRSPPRRRSDRKQQQNKEKTSQYKHMYLVSCHPGLEQVTAAELQQPGLELAQQVEVLAPGRVGFSCNSLAGGYAAALCLRSATRVLQLIHEEDLNPNRAAGDTVYDATFEAAAWQELLQPGQTLGVHCLHFYNNSNITNSQLVARRVRDAVCDAVREARGVRPAPPEDMPDLPLVFQMLNNKLQLFRDLGAGSLHRRGYRANAAVHKAALNEAAAAGLLLLAEWDERCQETGVVLADPMCGSGTFLIEAALIATNTAPGLLRQQWPFESWHDHDRQVQHEWEAVLHAAQQRSQQGIHAWQSTGGCILGNDLHKGALMLAKQAAASAGMENFIQFSQGPCGNWTPPKTPDMVVANPPWGKRLLSEGGGSSNHGSRESYRGSGRQQQWQQQRQQQYGDGEEEGDLVDTWQQLSTFLKQQCPGAGA